MTKTKSDIFDYSEFRPFISERLNNGPRGMQAQVAKAMQCQATYLIRVLKGTANMTEDQAFRCGRFLQLSNQELDYFLDLVRMDRAGDPNAKKYLQTNLKMKSRSAREIKNRVDADSEEISLSSQIKYYSSWHPSILHLATSCPQMQTVETLANKFMISKKIVHEVLSFLVEQGLVYNDAKGLYKHSGRSLHLGKDEPMHIVFQKVRREIITRRLGEQRNDIDLQFSSAFATSKEHIGELRNNLLDLIETSHKDLAETDSEEVALLVIDFLQLS